MVALAAEVFHETQAGSGFGLDCGFLMVGAPLFAHHGNAAYDTNKAVVFKGATVTNFVWANPHCIVMFDVKDDKGNVGHTLYEDNRHPRRSGPDYRQEVGSLQCLLTGRIETT